MSDAALVRKARAGDMQSFEMLLEKHFKMVFAIAFGRKGNRETAEDLTQEVFLRAYLYLDKIGKGDKFAGWLVRVTHNLANDWQRRDQRRSKLAAMVPMTGVHEDIPDMNKEEPSEAIDRREREHSVRDLILGLPPDQREIVLLRYSAGLRLSEISSSLGMHPATVGRKLKKALQSMKKSIEKTLVAEAPSLLPSKSATVRTLALTVAAAAMSSEARAALVEAAGGSTWAASLGYVAAVNKFCGLLKSLAALIAAGGKLMATGKGIATIATLSVLVAGSALYKQSNGDAVETVYGDIAAVEEVLVAKAEPVDDTGAVKEENADEAETPSPETSPTRGDGKILRALEGLAEKEAERGLPELVEISHAPFYQMKGGIWIDKGKCEAFKRNPVLLLGDAYGQSSKCRRVVNARLQTDHHFNVMAVMPEGEEALLYPSLQSAFSAHWNVDVKFKKSETDVYVLTVSDSGIKGLEEAAPDVVGSSAGYKGMLLNKTRCFRNLGIGFLAGDIERMVKKPVINETGLKDRYDLDIKWGSKKVEPLTRQLRDDLGLILTPARREINFMIIDEEEGPRSK
ncbi:TIGR03435 family protein [Candidatus Hydrogenedentota bacterium]